MSDSILRTRERAAGLGPEQAAAWWAALARVQQPGPVARLWSDEELDSLVVLFVIGLRLSEGHIWAGAVFREHMRPVLVRVPWYSGLPGVHVDLYRAWAGEPSRTWGFFRAMIRCRRGQVLIRVPGASDYVAPAHASVPQAQWVGIALTDAAPDEIVLALRKGAWKVPA